MPANVPVRLFQGGSVLQVAASGTIDAGAAGSVSLPASVLFTTGTVVQFRATDGTFAGTVSIGGTVGRWAFGSATLTNGTSLIFTGLSQVVSAHVNAVGAAPGTGAGTAASFQIEASRFANGTIYALGLIGTFSFTGAGTVLWSAFGY